MAEIISDTGIAMETLPTGFYPFWFWNDRISDEEIKWQVAQMASQDIRGFFIHSRQGLKDPPYLSDAFLDRVCTAVEAAAAHQMVVHLYDEYPYPSGVAGGLVTLGEPAFLATELVQDSFDVSGGEIRLDLLPGKVLSLLAYPMAGSLVDWEHPLDLAGAVGAVLEEDSYQETGLTRYNQKRYFANRPHPVLQTTLPVADWRIFSAQQCLVEHHKYWGHFSDVLNPRAVQRFIDLTHERYYRRLAKHFGKTIRWIFSDEVVPGWTAELPALFQQEYRYDLLPLLPALQDPTHPRHLQVSFDLHRLKLKRFSETFEEPVSTWCRAHGLAYAAEKPSLRFAQLRFQDIPGCEPGHVKAGGVLDLLQPSLRGNAKATASAAYFYGKGGALDECYHSLGWSATLEDIRWMADAQLLLGIRYLVPHGFFYSTHSLRKHDAPPSLFFQAPYWPQFGRLSARVEQIGCVFEGTYIDAQLAVVDPTAGLPSPADRAAYERLLHALMGAHLDFHVVDTDVLAEGTLQDGSVLLRDIRVNTVLLPPMAVIEPALAGWLERFRLAGGKIVRCSATDPIISILRYLTESIRPSLSLCSAGVENPALWTVQRRAPGRTLWFVLNISNQTQRVEIEAGAPLREISLEPNLTAHLENGSGGWNRTFQPFEACLLETVDQALPPTPPLPVVPISLSGPLEIRPLNSNLARLYTWQLSLMAEDGSVLQSASVPAVPLANQLEIGRIRFAPLVQRVFGTPPELAYPDLHLRYTCTFGCNFHGPLELLMEPDSIGGDWSLRINNSAALGPKDFQPGSSHVRGSLAVSLTDRIHPGENSLTIDVNTDRPEGGLLNPLYLSGDFGLTLNPLHLVERPSAGQFESYSANRLPYFAGIIEYRKTFHLAELPDAPRLLVRLDPPRSFHEACEISINGGPDFQLPWGPYQLEIERSALHPGSNQLKLRVFTSLIRSFEGQEFDDQQHRYIDIK